MKISLRIAAALCAAAFLLTSCDHALDGETAPKLTGTVSIEGEFHVGGTLQAQVTGLPAEAEKLAKNYEWHRSESTHDDGVESLLALADVDVQKDAGIDGIIWRLIPDANSQTYTLKSEDIGRYIKVLVSIPGYGSVIEPPEEAVKATEKLVKETPQEQPDTPNGNEGNENGAQGGEPVQSISYKDFSIDAVTGLPADDPDVNAAEKLVATLTTPAEEGPWTPELVVDRHDNHLFEIAQAENSDIWKILIKDSALPIGPYTVSVEISNTAGKCYYYSIKFSVSLTPPAFKTAPSVYPYITGVGQNKLTVYWDELPKGAKGFKLYIGATKNSADAIPYGDPIPENDAKNTDVVIGTIEGKYKADITDFTGDESVGFLPDGTTYYIWLKPYNDNGEGAFGPYATRTTSATLPEIFWKNVEPAKDSGYGEDFYCWDSFFGTGGKPTGDFYRILPPSEQHPGGYLIYGPPSSGETGMECLRGDIVYLMGAGYTTNSYGKGKWGEPLYGAGGNIIIKYEISLGQSEDGYWRPDKTKGEKNYMCVNFYALGTVQSVGPPTNVLAPYVDGKPDPIGRIICYFGNCWDLVYRRNPETDTFEQAVAKFRDGDKTLGSGKYIAGIATPWYRDYWTDRTVPPWAAAN